jgi:hypothetical protein
MQITTRLIQGQSLGQPDIALPKQDISKLWMGGLNWKQKKVAKLTIQEIDACCDRNAGSCDGCYRMRSCLAEWNRNMRCGAK